MSRNRKNSGIGMKIFCILLITMIAFYGLYSLGRWIEQKDEKPETRGTYEQQSDAVEYRGKEYTSKKDILSVLLIGADKTSSESGGQADFLQLLVIDNTAKIIKRLAIDRDTMTPITILGVLGNKSGVRTAQICLAHSFGDGKAQSCELTVEAVSNLLLGVDVDHYMALNLDAIDVLNDVFGGVTVTLEDDFSAIDPKMCKGTTLTLHGEQAEIYVRSRTSVGDGTNAARMKRQEQYLNKLFLKAEELIKNDKNFIGTVFDAVSDYLITDISRAQLINTAWSAKDFEIAEPLSISGEHITGSDGFIRFYADETSLYEIVLDMFYDVLK